jgi:hypothetical protein
VRGDPEPARAGRLVRSHRDDPPGDCGTVEEDAWAIAARRTAEARAAAVGPKETWQAERVSIWHAGPHDNPFGMRLTTLMLGKGIVDSAVPMSLLAEHPHVRFNFSRPDLGRVATEMH